jgi:hypothetical protein
MKKQPNVAPNGFNTLAGKVGQTPNGAVEARFA